MADKECELRKQSVPKQAVEARVHVGRFKAGSLPYPLVYERSLDWEIFETFDEADSRAKDLVGAHETYTIEQRTESTCERCEGTGFNRAGQRNNQEAP